MFLFSYSLTIRLLTSSVAHKDYNVLCMQQLGSVARYRIIILQPSCIIVQLNCIQLSQGYLQLAKENHNIVCTLQRLIQVCHKLSNIEIFIWKVRPHKVNYMFLVQRAGYFYILHKYL